MRTLRVWLFGVLIGECRSPIGHGVLIIESKLATLPRFFLAVSNFRGWDIRQKDKSFQRAQIAKPKNTTKKKNSRKKVDGL